VRIEASVGKDESCALDVEALAHTCELDVEFEWLGAETVGVSLWDGELTFGLGAGGAERVLARAALESPRDGLGGFHGTWRSPRDESSSVARVRIWLDGCVAETSWDDGEAMASCLVFPRRRAGRAEFRAVGGAARCRLSACVLGEGARSGLGEFPQARGPSLEE
jgi:hypothetical protein